MTTAIFTLAALFFVGAAYCKGRADGIRWSEDLRRRFDK